MCLVQYDGEANPDVPGFYKGIQSAGAAIFWRLDGLGKSYDTLFGATWGCLAASLLFAAPVILMRIKDSVSVEEDLKFSDETIEDVIAMGDTPKKVEDPES